jgi:hypothetical protein
MAVSIHKQVLVAIVRNLNRATVVKPGNSAPKINAQGTRWDFIEEGVKKSRDEILADCWPKKLNAKRGEITGARG